MSALLAVMLAHGACNVTVLHSYFADGTPAQSCFAEPFLCESSTSRLVATLDANGPVFVTMHYASTTTGNYAVYAARSGDVFPAYEPCTLAREDYLQCGGNLLKITTAEVWNVRRIGIAAHSCRESQPTSAQGSVIAVTVAVAVAAGLFAAVACTLRHLQTRRKAAKSASIGASTTQEPRPAFQAPNTTAEAVRQGVISAHTELPAAPVVHQQAAPPKQPNGAAPRRSRSFETPHAVAPREPVRRSQSVRTSRMRTRPRAEHRIGTNSRVRA